MCCRIAEVIYGMSTSVIQTRIVIAVLLSCLAVWLPVKVHEAAEVAALPVHYVPTNERIVALTYDDGPYPLYTPKLLHVLKYYHVRATFFVIGERAKRWPDIVREAARDGHVIANHTYTHPAYFEYLPPAQITQELSCTQHIIYDLTGRRYGFFRPPKGLVNHNLAATARADGYQIILWSVSADHHEAKTPEEMAERVIRRIRPGSIILMHDGRFAVRWRDVAATPIIIRALKERGYRFVTVPELLDKLRLIEKLRAK